MKDTLIGERYLLLDLIGSGGEAKVFRTRDTATGNEVAARLPLQPGPFATTNPLPAFHAGWVKLLDSGYDAQHGAYQIFDLLEGQTLGQQIKSAPLEPESWFLFVDQSLAAVGALHDAGWIHGDLNANNFIQINSPDPRWKLLELPFLRFTPPKARTALFGSIYTLAPEQIDGALADVRSDLFALGCLYYYAASGHYPHSGANVQDIAIDRLRFTPTPLAERAPRLPASWSAWVMPLLEREPDRRPPSVATARQLLKVA